MRTGDWSMILAAEIKYLTAVNKISGYDLHQTALYVLNSRIQNRREETECADK